MLRLVFRRDLAETPSGTSPPGGERPVFVLVVLGLTLAGFAVTSFAGWSPAWAALDRRGGAGCALTCPAAQHDRRHHPLAEPSVLPVRPRARGGGQGGHGQRPRQRRPGPPASGSGLAALLGIAALAAVLSNAVNNLPAVLVLLPLVSGPPAVLAVLIGVNIGPNLTYVGSLANLLWRGYYTTTGGHQRGRVQPAGAADRSGMPGGGRRGAVGRGAADRRLAAARRTAALAATLARDLGEHHTRGDGCVQRFGRPGHRDGHHGVAVLAHQTGQALPSEPTTSTSGPEASKSSTAVSPPASRPTT